jgi:transcriptional regulator with XRE-family HTH domain
VQSAFGPNPIDVHVGARVRARRKEIGLSQERLAGDLGLTFQQVQKYERGANRISSSKLYEIARLLRTPVHYFFEGLTTEEQTPARPEAAEIGAALKTFLSSAEGQELAAMFPKIKHGATRRRVLELVRTMAQEQDGTVLHIRTLAGS